MKITKEQLLKVINEVINAEKDSDLPEAAKRILPAIVNLSKFKNTEDFLARTSLLISSGYDFLEMTLKIDNATAGIVSYKRLTRQDAKNGIYCRPDPFPRRPTYMLENIGRDTQFKGYGVGRFLGFISVCYVNNNGGTVTSDRNTSDFAGKQLIDSLSNPLLGVQKSKSFDYVGWLLSSLQKVFFKSSQQPNFNTEPLSYHYDEIATSSKQGAKGRRENRKLEATYNKEIKDLLNQFFKKHKPLTAYKNDDCYPSVNITFGPKDISLMNMYYDPSFKDFLKRAINMSTEELQDALDSDERVQGYTFVLSDIMISAGIDIIDLINDTSLYDDRDEEFEDEFNKGSKIFSKVYTKSVTEPGVGTRNIDVKLQAED